MKFQYCRSYIITPKVGETGSLTATQALALADGQWQALENSKGFPNLKKYDEMVGFIVFNCPYKIAADIMMAKGEVPTQDFDHINDGFVTFLHPHHNTAAVLSEFLQHASPATIVVLETRGVFNADTTQSIMENRTAFVIRNNAFDLYDFKVKIEPLEKWEAKDTLTVVKTEKI